MTVNILGVDIDCVDFAATLEQIDHWIDVAKPDSPAGPEQDSHRPQQKCRQICTVNPEFLVDAYQDPDFAAVLARADLRVPDGVGILAAARLLGVRLRERVTGSDGIYVICQRAAEQGWSVFLLGAAPGVAANAAAVLQRSYGGLRVAGTFSGSPAEDDWPKILHQLQSQRLDILFVAFGHPEQDRWIDRHRAQLPARVAIGVGGAFDFVAGVTVRAPHWMQRLGLEWLHRLIRQPWRWRRMIKLPLFVLLVVRQRIVGGRHAPSPPG